jgi:hypothetical protein
MSPTSASTKRCKTQSLANARIAKVLMIRHKTLGTWHGLLAFCIALAVGRSSNVGLHADEWVDAVVIGAGVSGLATADALVHKLGIKSVVVLEGSHKIGGRVEGSYFSEGVNVGAAWIHRAGGNPTTALARKHGCRMNLTDNKSVRFFDEQGRMIPPKVVTDSQQRVHALVLKFLQQREAQLEAGVPHEYFHAQSLVRGLESLSTNDPPPSPLTRAEWTAEELHFFRDVVQDMTADLEQISAGGFHAGLYGGTGADAILLDDFMCAFAPLAEGLDVRLGQKVRWIPFSLTALTYCTRTVLTYCTHLLHSYCTHTVRILYAYCTHTVLVLYSYCTRTVLVLYSYCTH